MNAMLIRILCCSIWLFIQTANADVVNRAKAGQLVKEYIAEHGGERMALTAAKPVAEEKIFICGVCHGKDGNSTHPDIPSLAGQNPPYIVEQLLNFKTKKRLFQAMHELAGKMSNEQMAAVALHFSRLKRVGVSVNATLAAKGKPLYDAVCQHCHGADGNGLKGYARLSAQRPEYVAKNLKRFRDGAMERKSPEMGVAAKGLTDQEIEALAAYVASL